MGKLGEAIEGSTAVHVRNVTQRLLDKLDPDDRDELLRYLRSDDVSAPQIARGLASVFGDDAPSEGSIRNWQEADRSRRGVDR